jgi:hypothetical protein
MQARSAKTPIREAEKRTDARKDGWTPDVGKEGKGQSHKAPENAYQGGGKPAGRAGVPRPKTDAPSAGYLQADLMGARNPSLDA